MEDVNDYYERCKKFEYVEALSDLYNYLREQPERVLLKDVEKSFINKMKSLDATTLQNVCKDCDHIFILWDDYVTEYKRKLIDFNKYNPIIMSIKSKVTEEEFKFLQLHISVNKYLEKPTF